MVVRPYSMMSMTSFWSMEDPSSHRMLLHTLENFDYVATNGTGAILYPRRFSGTTPVAENLQAAAVASRLGLTSIDYARSRYAQAPHPAGHSIAEHQYSRSYGEATQYIDACLEAMEPNLEAALGIGTYAASVALERLPSSFLAAHLLYRLGLNFEGDAVARQILEQVAWSLGASEIVDEEKLMNHRFNGNMHRLKKLVPYAGGLYGRLSKSAHASLAEHLTVFAVQDGRGSIQFSRSRLAESALNLLQLADLWVVTYEYTQRDHMTAFAALDSKTFEVLDRRRFEQAMHDLVVAVAESEEAEVNAQGSESRDPPDSN